MNKLNKLHFLVILFLTLSITSCSEKVQESSNIADPNSKLIQMSLMRSDFDNHWIWLHDDITQKFETPSNDNHGLVESLFHGMEGDYYNKNLIYVIHRIERYRTEIDWQETFQIKTGIDIVAQDNIKLPLSENMKLDCQQVELAIGCEIIVQYKSIISDTTIYAPASIDHDLLHKLLEKVITAIKARSVD